MKNLQSNTKPLLDPETITSITHDPDFARRSDLTIEMQDGRIAR